jgi:hypothetical protein
MTAAGEISQALGGAYRSGRWWRCRCPVHQSHGATLALRDGDHALIVVCHAGCSRSEILGELHRLNLLGVTRDTERPPPTPNSRDDVARRTLRAAKIWDAAQEGRNSPVKHWLATRGIHILVPRTLRWARSCRHLSGTYCAAMIARVDNVDGEFVGVHKTFLLPDGSAKAPLDPVRTAVGPTSGGAVRLAPAGEFLLVGEGIETCFAAMQACRLPAWAALSTSGLRSLILPPPGAPRHCPGRS